MSEQSIELVEGVYGAFARGDVPAVLGAFADDIEWYEAEGMPYGGLHRGGEAVAQKVFGPITEDVEGFAVVPDEFRWNRRRGCPLYGDRQSDREGLGPARRPHLGYP
jgi:ketosteroid isomerase-like protein